MEMGCVKVGKKKYLTKEEVVIVALAQRSSVPERIKNKAKKIIKRHKLTDEEIKKCYNFLFGEEW